MNLALILQVVLVKAFIGGVYCKVETQEALVEVLMV